MLKEIKKWINPIKQEILFYKNWSHVDFSQLSYLVIFLGSPRSGTTLIRTIIDAHPNAAIGNEVHLARELKRGKDWTQTIKRICVNRDQFSKNPIWTNYDYQIENIKNTKKTLKIIGDKQSLGTVKFLINEPQLLNRFLEWSPLPCKIIRCVRHPYDVIATKHWRNKKSLDWNIDEYFFAEINAEKLVDCFGRHQTHYIYHEQLILNPELKIGELFDFLELSVNDNFITACRNRINPKLSMSRKRAQWNSVQIKRVEQTVNQIEHLHGYLKNGRLFYNIKMPVETK